jgi:hypothetical protein
MKRGISSALSERIISLSRDRHFAQNDFLGASLEGAITALEPDFEVSLMQSSRRLGLSSISTSTYSMYCPLASLARKFLASDLLNEPSKMRMEG